MDKLLPCPFCGGKAEYYLDYIQCANCLASMLYEQGLSYEDGKKQAIAAWNRRDDGWIPVSEALPEKNGSILICRWTEGFRRWYQGCYLGDGEFRRVVGIELWPFEPTHWKYDLCPPKEAYDDY